MTNREYLATLDSQRLTDWILGEAVEIARMSNNSRLWLAEWLDSEYQGWINMYERGAWIMAQIEKGGAE
jgi:hypothetical protein